MGTHTPRSLLWLLSNGSDQFGLVELLRSMPAAEVDSEAEALLLAQVRTQWGRGWQPAELHRQGRRGCAAAGARLIALAIAVDHAGRTRDDLDARWRAQIDRLGLPRATGGSGWLTGFAAHERLDRTATLHAVVDALRNLVRLPKLDPLLPPPGSAWSARSAQRSSTSADPVLAKIRGLLAKAESTTFEAEATAFTAKAQELMTRHAIDMATLHGEADARADTPSVIRVPVDSPYSQIKGWLLQTVAEASRCRALELSGLGLSVVVGTPSDLTAVEMLFTSLLVQAQIALGQAPRSTRSYRSSFLLSYSARIGERLHEINDAVFAAAENEHGGSFLPVLRSQAEAVDEFIEQRFGKLRMSRMRGGDDPAGWASGRVAADKARLAFGDLADAM